MTMLSIEVFEILNGVLVEKRTEVYNDKLSKVPRPNTRGQNQGSKVVGFGLMIKLTQKQEKA